MAASRRVSHAPPLSKLLPFALGIVCTLAFGAPAGAQTWNETGDAGDLPATAQVTLGPGTLGSINGTLASASDVDMYCIRIMDPSFIARLQCVAIQGPHLWLFDATGMGVSAATTCQAGDKRITTATVFSPGLYYVAVSYDGVDPFSGANLIWNHLYTTERAPDGPGAAGTITSWAGTGNVQPLNPYTILFTGVAFCDAATSSSLGTWGRIKQIYR